MDELRGSKSNHIPHVKDSPVSPGSVGAPSAEATSFKGQEDSGGSRVHGLSATPANDNTGTRIMTQSYEAFSTNRALTVDVDGKAPTFQLRRSSTIVPRGDEGWNPKSDVSETDGTVPDEGSSDVFTSRAACSSTRTSPLLPALRPSPHLTPSLGDWAQPLPGREEVFHFSIGDLTEEEEEEAENEERVYTSQDPTSQETEDDSLDDAQLAAIRGHGVSRLEVSNRGLRYEASIITDGGDQQFKIQKQASALDNATEALDSSLGHNQATIHDVITPSLPWQDDPDYVGAMFVLSNKIVDAMGQNRNPRQPRHERGFLPKAQLDVIINPDSVLQELYSCLVTLPSYSKERMKECAENVCRETKINLPNGKTKIRSFRKIFAILVLIEKPWAIFKFLEEGVSDLDLPLVIDDHKVYRGLKELRRRDVAGNPSPRPLQCSSGWPSTSVMNFETYQWTMLAPFFCPGEYDDVRHYVLHDQHILPFVNPPKEEEDEIADLGGGFGRVFMVYIHPEHHNFRHPRARASGFAIKKLYESDRTMFNREVSILKRFSGSRAHPHIVSLLATYEQFRKFHLIFYKAEGDLLKYWKRINPLPDFDYENVLWMAKQCKGIANALLCLHKHYTLERSDVVRQQEEEEHEDKPAKTAGRPERMIAIPHTPGKRDNTKLSPIGTINPTWPARFFPGIGSDPQELPPHSTDERLSPPFRRQRFRGDPYLQWGRHGDPYLQWGRHGDLKPENILFFSDMEPDDSDGNGNKPGGTLKISDFGQAQLNSKSRKSNLQSGEVAQSLAYRAPESDLQPRKISQSHDIWSLGCVFLEFIAWALGGARLLTEFAEKRISWDIFMKAEIDTFFEIVKNKDTLEPEIMVKPTVTKFICELHSHPNCTEYFHGFLDMIEHNMLLIEPTNGEKARMSIEEVHKGLAVAYKRCCVSRDYAIKKNPWMARPPNAEPLMRSVKVEMTGAAKQVIKENKPFLRVHQGPTENDHLP